MNKLFIEGFYTGGGFIVGVIVYLMIIAIATLLLGRLIVIAIKSYRKIRKYIRRRNMGGITNDINNDI